jgi:hypothetical protein
MTLITRSMRSHARLWRLVTFLSASPAFASNNPLNRGPVADFLSGFRAQAIPRQVVIWRHSEYGRGSVVVSTTERRLYYVLGNGQAIEYGVGIGRQGFTWSGTKTVRRKREWPDRRPPAQMLKRRPDLPKHMEGGIENPLGARHLPGVERVSNPWLKRAGYDRNCCLLRLYSHDEPRRHRPL